MIRSVNMLMPFRAEFEGGSKIFFVDLSVFSVYNVDGSEVSDEETKDFLLSHIKGQQEATVPDIPYQQIGEVLNTEKKLEQENNKHIFRRR